MGLVLGEVAEEEIWENWEIGRRGGGERTSDRLVLKMEYECYEIVLVDRWIVSIHC